MHMSYEANKPLADQFMDAMSSPDPAINETLSSLLTTTSDLQNRLVPGSAFLAFFAAFIFTVVGLWILLASPSGNTAYKGVLATFTLLNSYGLTVGFMVALATRQACKALQFSAAGTLSSKVYVTVNTKLQDLQWAMLGIACVLQLVVAYLFVQRHVSSENVSITLLPANGFKGRGHRRR
jgi:hypothetical protein